MRLPFTRANAAPDTTPSATYGSDRQSAYDESVDDQNALWRGMQRYQIINDMRFSDPKVKLLVWLIKLPMRGAQWDSVPATDDELGKQVNDDVQWQFGLGNNEGQMFQTWDQWQAQKLLKIEFGSMWEEIIWGEDLVRGPSGRLLRPIVRMAPRFPSTIKRISLDPRTGRPAEILQNISGTKPIPGDKLAVYVLDQEGTDWRGISMLRSMYGSWRHKRLLLTASGIAWDRWGIGIPWARFPAGGGAKAKREAQGIVRNLRGNERAWYTMEGAPPPLGGWDVGILNGQISDSVPLLRHHDEQMASAALAMFTGLGTTETGSRAVGDTLSTAFYEGALALAKDLASETHKQAVRRFVDENYGRDVPAPRIVVSKVSSKSAADVVNALTLLAGAGADVLHPEQINAALDLMELPRLPEDSTGVREGESVTNGNGNKGGDAKRRLLARLTNLN